MEKLLKLILQIIPELVEKLSSKDVSIIATPLEDKMPSLLGILTFLVSNVFANWCLDFLYASNARRKRWSHGIWKIKSKIIK